MKHHCHKYFILPIELKNDRGATVSSSEVSDLTIKVWTQSPDFALVFHADDLKEIDGAEALSIPNYFMATLPAGTVVYEYRFFTEGNPREIKHRTVTSQVWKRNLPLSYYEELKAFREMVKVSAESVEEKVSDVKNSLLQMSGDVSEIGKTVKAMTERNVNFLVNEEEGVKLNGYDDVDIFVAPPLQAQAMESLSMAGRKKIVAIGADFTDINQAIENLKKKTQFAGRTFLTQFNTTISHTGGVDINYMVGSIADAAVSTKNFTIPNATTSSAGVMTPKDKTDLDYLTKNAATRTELAQLKSDLLGDDLEATFNTLKEVQDWADEHGTEYAELVKEVQKKADADKAFNSFEVFAEGEGVPVYHLRAGEEGALQNIPLQFGDDFAVSSEYSTNGIMSPTVRLSDKAKMALFDDMWVALDGTIVDKQRHIYGLNGLDDITYEQAVAIREKANFAGLPNTNLKTVVIRGCRTNFPPSTSQEIVSLNNCGCDSMVEVLALIPNKATIMCNGFSGFVNNAPNLREIHGIINVNNVSNLGTSYLGCPELTYFRITNLGCNLNLSRCQKLDIESFNYLVQHSDKTKTFTVTVHADVYAKLTDEGNAEWHKVLTDALERNISFATA